MGNCNLLISFCHGVRKRDLSFKHGEKFLKHNNRLDIFFNLGGKMAKKWKILVYLL